MTSKFDKAVLGGKVYLDGRGFVATNVYVSGSTIAKVSDEVLDAADVYRADGLHVIPGLIDTHTHHRDPGFTHKEDATTATAAAAVGGVTVTLAMPNVKPPTASLETLDAQLVNYSDKAIVDWNINPSASDPALLAAMAARGILAFKIYMVVDSKRPYPHMPEIGIHHHAHILEIMESGRETGLPIMVHPNDQAIFELQERRHFEQGVVAPDGYGKQDWMFDSLAWSSGVATLVEINHVVGGRLHLCHMVSDRTVEHVRRAKADGDRVTSEVNAFALFQSDPEEMRHLGPYSLGRYLKPHWVEALWAGIKDGSVDVVGTDHAPHTRDEKDIGWDDMWRAPSGTPAMQHYLMKLLDSHHQGKISLEDLVEVAAVRPAKIFGLAPRKGIIAEGSDADLVVLDVNAVHTITDDEVLSKCGWTPYRGQLVRGVPRATMLRGQYVAKELKLVAGPGYGTQATPVGFTG